MILFLTSRTEAPASAEDGPGISIRERTAALTEHRKGIFAAMGLAGIPAFLYDERKGISPFKSIFNRRPAMILKGTIIHAPELGKLSILKGGYLLLDEEGRIQSVTDTLPPEYAGKPVEDFGDCLILQSFADLHLHGPQYPQVGMGMDLQLLPWLKTYTFPAEARFSDPGYARNVYHHLAAELIANGSTRVSMFSSLHTEATWILMEELEQAGITGYVGKVNMDRNGGENLQETTEESERETLRWLEGCSRFHHIKPILTPRFTPSCTDELMEWLGKLSAERNLPVQSHLSENKDEIAWVKDLHPECEEYWETYQKYGLWGNRTLMAHCVHSSPRERKAMKDHGVTMVHCPDSNINVCSGIAPVRQFLQEGIAVTLGSDIAGGAKLPMYQVIACAIQSSKIRNMMDGSAFLTAAEAYYLGTTAGQQYFGAGKGFAVGDRLHAIIVDDSRMTGIPGMTPADRLERFFYQGKAADIKAVFSEGRRVK